MGLGGIWMKLNKYIGDKKFYKMVLLIAIPIMVQNGITNFVSMLDNIMVGQIGTDQMSGVAIVNQLIFVFNLCIFGGISGIGIFGAQFWGKKDFKGLRETFRLKIILCIIVALVSIALFKVFDISLISLFLHEGSNSGDIASTLLFGKEYLSIMLIGLIPFAIMQAYSSTLRETGETILPMKAGIVAVFVNLILNYILIFGKFGVQSFGVNGAAIATVISRFVECIIVVAWSHVHKEKNVFLKGVYSNFTVSKKLIKQVTIKGAPLMINEVLWSAGMSALVQCYSMRGLAVVAGINIASTISNVFGVVYIALGNAVAIIVGQILGAGKMEEAKDTDTKLIFFSVMSCICIGLIMIVIAPLFPKIYNTTSEVKDLARNFIIILAICMPLNAFTNASYFTLRSGGKTIVTFLFDSMFVWVINIPVAYLLVRFSSMNIMLIYFICQSLEIIKCIIGYVLVKSGVWLQNLV